ncbi:hypothetical protein AgCh_006300 [Apium graveolens]
MITSLVHVLVYDLCKSYVLVIFFVGSSHLKDIFYRMGLSDKDIVALYGGIRWEKHMLTDQALMELGQRSHSSSSLPGYFVSISGKCRRAKSDSLSGYFV